LDKLIGIKVGVNGKMMSFMSSTGY